MLCYLMLLNVNGNVVLSYRLILCYMNQSPFILNFTTEYDSYPRKIGGGGTEGLDITTIVQF